MFIRCTKTLLSTLVIAVYVTSVQANNASGSSAYFSTRPQGTNAVRELVGWQELINTCDADDWYGALGLTVEYDQSFKAERIAQSLFGNDATLTPNCTATLGVSGSRAATRGNNDWLADYFGLPTDFQSTISLCPKIQNIIGDIELYIGFDRWVPGLYARLGLPITHTRWQLNACETVAVPGTEGYTYGYFDSSQEPTSNLLSYALEFLSGCKSARLVNQDGTTVTFQPLQAARFSPCVQTKTRLADVELVVGYNAICCDSYRVGFNARAFAPTGNHPCGTYTFEPVAGNGGSWELGVGLSAYVLLWESELCASSFAFYVDANVTHLFNSCQTRVFDLCEKPNSRYQLAARLEAATNGLVGNSTADLPGTATIQTASTYQFANEFAPVANLTKRCVNVSAAAQGDVAFKVAYNNGNGFSWDLGYAFWGRTCEKVCLTGCGCTPLDNALWVLKGDSQVYGFFADTVGTTTPLAPSQSKSDIHAGTNFFGPGSDTTTSNSFAITNPNIDNAQFAAVGESLLYALPSDSVIADQTNTSIQPVLLKDSNLNISGTQAYSNRVFTHFNYTWIDHECILPFLGVGAAAEFGHAVECPGNCPGSASLTTNCASCNSCNTSALSMWSVWLKGGIAF